MARFFDDTQLEYLSRPTLIVPATLPLAMVCWFKPDDITNGYCLMSICDTATNLHNMALYAQGTIGGDPVRFQMSDAGGWDIADSTAGYTANNWHHACGITVTTTDRRAYLDGANKGVDAGFCFPTGLDTTAIGVMRRLAPVSYMSGAIAEAAIYSLSYLDGALFSDKADNFENNVLPALAAGYSPLHFPLGLVAYWPLHGLDTFGFDQNIVSHEYLIPFNVPTWVDHPRVFMPKRSQPTTPRGVIPGHGMLGSEPILTGTMKIQPALTGVMKNETILTGKFKNYTGA